MSSCVDDNPFVAFRVWDAAMRAYQTEWLVTASSAPSSLCIVCGHIQGFLLNLDFT